MKPLRPLAVALAALLIALQVIAPFLHAHVGTWRIGGLHLDGVAPHSLTWHADDPHRDRVQPRHSLDGTDPESPAIGVAAGWRDDAEAAGWLPALLGFVLVMLTVPRSMRVVGRPLRPTHPLRLVPRLRPPNAPPPAIAPPTLR